MILKLCKRADYAFLSMRSTDPTHQRANGNLKYFEVQLEKQRKAMEAAEGDNQQKKQVDKRDVQLKRSRDPLPERKRYEQLCRGEGVKMVRTPHLLFFSSSAFTFFHGIHSFLTSIITAVNINCSFFFLY